ncbi:MAG: hypothetical protein UZ14_CFX002002710 [Chloroflexi bacterium OLB14]|nr:MAG: hypothetical protein UZ14_CFX002002710 [Chloroflexi bacterium OLB14]
MTVTSQVTVTSPPPTETPIPTPTLHPDFVAVQNQFAEISEHLTLLPDGTVEEMTTDGGRQTIPNLHVDENGTITILVEGQPVTLTTADLSFDNEKGLFVNGYELNEDGEWVEAHKLFSLDQVTILTPEEKIENAIDIDGYTPYRSAERYVFYENGDGVRDVAYDLTTGEKVEIPQYQICSPEKFYECEVSPEDLMSGKYWLWLNTLDVGFDPEKIKDVPLVSRNSTYGGWVQVTEVYHDSGWDKPVDFADPATAPFDRDVTGGVVLYDTEGVKSFGILRPVAFYDKKIGQIHWVVSEQSLFAYHEGRDTDPKSPRIQPLLTTWERYYNVTPLMTNIYSINTGVEDPVLSHTYEAYPDIEQRFANFANGDLSALSAPGLVVQTGSKARPTTNQYK